MFGDIIQPTHLLFILVVALVVLGPKRLPEVGRSLGKGLRDFRSAMSGVQEEAHNLMSLEPTTDTTSTEPVAVGASVVEPAAATEPDPADYAD
ncbi:MAG: Sec-independent protein translocase subunit TatA/TatB [Solirubrobacteraceae bacterium]